MRAWISKTLPYVTKDWKTKVVSLLVAIIAFYSIRSMISDRSVFIIPVEVVSPSAVTGVTPVAAMPAEVRVTLRGTRAQLQGVRRTDLKALAKPRGRSSSQGIGSQFAAVSLTTPGKEFKLRVLEIDPPEVKVKFDTLRDVTLEVERPALVGKPLAGTAVVEWPKAQQVVVRGALMPLMELKKHQVKLPTEEINVEGLTQSFVKRVKVMLPKDIGKVQVSPEDIEVRVRIDIEQASVPANAE